MMKHMMHMLLGLQWEVRKEAALSAIVGQQKEKEAVEAENAANSAKLAENRAHVSTFPPLCSCQASFPCTRPGLSFSILSH